MIFRVGLSRPTDRPAPRYLALAIGLFLVAFLVVPVATVVYVAFTEKGGGGFTLVNFVDFARTDLFVRSFWNSIYVSAMTVLWSSAFALPLAYLTTRFEFRGAGLVQTLGFLPLIMPPFVGAVAMQLLFGRNGTVNLLLDEHFGFKIGFMEGLNGVIFLQAIHYFPFILVNLSAALRNIDRSMEEAAQNLGSHGLRLFRRIAFPLALPGYVAGASLVFVKVFDDVASPLLLNVKEMLAPQAYLRITSIGIDDPMGYVIAVVLIVIAVVTMWGSAQVLKGKDYATTQRGGGGLARRPLDRPAIDPGLCAGAARSWPSCWRRMSDCCCCRFATVWSFSPLPDGYTLAHYARVLGDSSVYITNTLLYSGLAAAIDVVLGGAIAYLVLRTRLPGRSILDWGAGAALAVPGVVLGIGYLRAFYGVKLPDGTPLAALWIMIVLAIAIRRLPYALRAAYAALQQISVSLEEAAENLGATKSRTVRRIVIPLMTGGLLAGFVTSFATAAVELSAVLMLVQNNSDAPLSYGLYVLMQTPAGRGAGAALGVIAVIIVAVCMGLSQLVADRSQRARGLDL